jgi:hypothetical protein
MIQEPLKVNNPYISTINDVNNYQPLGENLSSDDYESLEKCPSKYSLYQKVLVVDHRLSLSYC